MIFPAPIFLKHKSKLTGDCCVFKFLLRNVDGEHLMRFQSENTVFKFVRRSVESRMSEKDKQSISCRTVQYVCTNNYYKWSLLSNCSEYRPNNSTKIYSDIVQEKSCLPYLYSRKPVCRTGRRAHAKLSNSPSFIDKFIYYSSWIINLLLDVLVCSVAVYFYLLFVFWLALRARQNTAQLVKIYSDTAHQNIW